MTDSAIRVFVCPQPNGLRIVRIRCACPAELSRAARSDEQDTDVIAELVARLRHLTGCRHEEPTMSTPPAGALVGEAGSPEPIPAPVGSQAQGAGPTPEERSEQRWRTAHHEAGHALLQWVYGHGPEAVSIRPGEHYRGITFGNATDLADLDLGALLSSVGGRLAPLQLQPPEVRATLERHIIVDLAGHLAGELAGLTRQPTGYLPEPDTAALEAVLDALPPRSRELIVAAEASSEPSPTDEESAWFLAGLLVEAESERVPYLNWLRASAETLLIEHWARVSRLAAALLERGYLDGPEAVAILRGDNAAVIPQPAGLLPAEVKE